MSIGWAPLSAQTTTKTFGDKATLKKITKKGVDFLLQKGQAEDGSFSKQISPAVTALCLSALLENGVPASDQRIQKGLKFLESMVKEDGGVYPKGSTLRNYETSVSIMCFKRANKEGKYDKTIQKAVAFLKGIQWDDAEGHTTDSDFYGGLGYGSHKRPDLSNTSYFVDAMKAAGEDPKSEAMQKALRFISRAQNLPSKHNPMKFAQNAREDDKGGMIYTPANGGESKVESSDEDKARGGLRSYASMTYAGLKSLLYAGVSKDDIRIKAAMDWISRHYDVTSNPGMGKQGLFYYYHVFGKTLNAIGVDEVVDAEKVRHDWRKDLIQQLASQQSNDGSWTNPADRWFEGDPNLVTAYALLALSYCD